MPQHQSAPSKSHVPPGSALGPSDIQRVDVAVVVADLEPTEFAVPAA